MATVNFLYRSTKNKADLTLRLLFRYMGKDIVIGSNSKITIEKTFWLKHLNQKNLKDVNLINEQTRAKKAMNDLTSHILNRLNSSNVNIVNKDWLKYQINEFYNPRELKTNIPIFLTDYFDYYVELLITNKNTKKKLITTKNKIKKYEEEVKNKLAIEALDNAELNLFKRFLTELKYNQNTILVDFTNIKTICRHAKSTLKVNEEIFNWSLKKEKNIIVYLNFDEIKRISELTDLPEYLDNARDWLIISCFTGQRVSDFMKFDKTKIRTETVENGKIISYVEFTQKKTNQNIILPLHKEVVRILEKRKGDFPRPTSDVKYNKYIKLVAKIANISDPIEGSKLDAKINRKVKRLYPKNELITSHIGRRSFATNHYGIIPTPLLMSATGHQTEKMFLNYIGKSQTDRAKSLSNYF
ncbi:phage integrase SAM-like domain-containing protein [Flavobacterium sp.]|uniref:phage integrase SAM-like domain-containing protein n=1 Tax=Flavobacterium sp. TaxID=239 RepID=UPI00352948E8